MRVGVVGWALRCALGDNVETVFDALCAGQSGFAANPHFAAESYPCRLAAAIEQTTPQTLHARMLRRTGLFAVEVALEALAMSGVSGGERVGVFSGVGGLRVHWDDMVPALAQQRDDLESSWSRGLVKLHPFWMLKHLSNNAHAIIAQETGAVGDGVTAGGGVAGAQALANAAAALRVGAVDAALVVAHDSLIEPEVILDWSDRGQLATCDVDAWRGPYDRQASGSVPAEAAAAIVLAKDRGIYAVDAATGADGATGLPAMTTLAQVTRRLKTATVVDGIGLGVPAVDAAECDLFVRADAITAIQSGLGATGAVKPLLQSIILGHALQRQRLPPIASLYQPGALAPLLQQANNIKARHALGHSIAAPGLAAAVHVTLD